MSDTNARKADGPQACRLPTMMESLRHDVIAGFLVFLIALPLCLGIALASGFPAHAGILTAIVGGILCPLLSDSQLTIKGPAAGLIVIVLGAVTEFGGGPVASTESQFQAYHMVVGLVLASGLVQVAIGLARAGTIVEMVPVSVVHGMLAAIGIIIAAKQSHVMLGVSPEAVEPLGLLAEIPHSIKVMNPEVAVIGLLSLGILFGLPLLRHRWMRLIPAPMLVMAVAVPLGTWFDLDHEHTYTFLGQEYTLSPKAYLVNLPGNLDDYLAFPDLGVLWTWSAWKWVFLFAVIGSLESTLSAKAVDLIDPWQRRTNLNRDLFAVGVANTLIGLVGGLPLISEIVRSSANRNFGARTRSANMIHGLFLAGAVMFLPQLVHQIPLAALAALLVYTGWRLASPREWVAVYRIGREQLVIFSVTVIVILATDLLIGMAAGILVKLLIHWLQSAPCPAISLVKLDVVVEALPNGGYHLQVRQAVVFSNWLILKRLLLGLDGSGTIVLDLTTTNLVDHTVMEKLHEMAFEFEAKGRCLEVIGLDHHESFSGHPRSARRKSRHLDALVE